ncbi:MAG TPA: AraC family transcriptional regulator ligand-binding domain-containing protein [Polyangiaceae bacterium]|nr:AraC family transcriptional regulator ligand-binding domain-containing protein [Polyangiaceae bacterium]
MPRDLKLRRRDPLLALTHIALGSWMIAALGQHGFSAAGLLRFARANLGLSAEAALKLTRAESDGYFQAKDCFALWEAALATWERQAAPGSVELLPAILREVRCASLGVLGFQMATAPTLGVACEAFCRGFPLLSTSGTWTSLQCEDEVTFVFDHLASDRSTCLFNEAMLSIFVRVIEEIADTPLLPLRVNLSHPRAATSSGLERAIPSPVSYSARGNGLTFAVSQLERPLRLAHSGMHQHFEGEVSRTLKALPAGDDIAEALRRHLRREAILTQECLIEASSRLELSPRTLQRRLAMAGTSFSDELATVRRERAHQLVAFSRRPLAVVAHDLGFADCTAFSRAFRRWFDASPGVVRSSNRDPSQSSWPQAKSCALEGAVDLSVGA